MVVIVDENSGESATAVLEDQLQVRTLEVGHSQGPCGRKPWFGTPVLQVLSHCSFRGDANLSFELPSWVPLAVGSGGVQDLSSLLALGGWTGRAACGPQLPPAKWKQLEDFVKMWIPGLHTDLNPWEWGQWICTYMPVEVWEFQLCRVKYPCFFRRSMHEFQQQFWEPQNSCFLHKGYSVSLQVFN